MTINNIINKFLYLGIAVIILIINLTGCSDRENTVATDGSTSVEKTIGSLGEAFEIKYSDVTFTYNPTGSGGGITAVQDGRCDIGLSSRALTDDEKKKGLIGTELAYDGIAIIVNKNNPISDLSVELISKIYTGELKNWKDVHGKAGEIVLIGREANSGTRDGFESATATQNKCKYRQELTATGDVISAVAGNPNAIGYASVASVKNNVKTVKVEGVFPEESTIKNGTYKIQRPFILVTKNDNKLSETSKLFFEFCFSEEAKPIIRKAGVVPAN